MLDGIEDKVPSSVCLHMLGNQLKLIIVHKRVMNV